MSTPATQRDLTPAQRRGLRAIWCHWQEHGMAPSYRELMTALGYSGTNALYAVVLAPLQARVDDKSIRLKVYEGAVGENWLVIVADGTKPSQLFDVPQDFDPRTVASPFSRTFFYGYPGRAIIEFGVAGTTQCARRR